MIEIFSQFIKKNYLQLAIAILFGVIAGFKLIGPGYFNMHDDLQVMRQVSIEKCFFDLQIPCRWVPDMGYGYGFPLYNFYPQLPYVVGLVVRLITPLGYLDTVKLVFILSFVFSSLFMYLLSRQFFGKIGGLVSAAFYVFAPYHSVDVYVRGAMNESWALVFFPLILWSSYKIIKLKERRYFNILILAFAWVGLLTSHNLMVLIFTPIFAVWCGVFILKNKSFDSILYLLISGLMAFGLAAFFTLPVVFEQKLVHADTLIQGYYEFSTHFLSLKQLIVNRYWGYGPSIWEPLDGFSLQIGIGHILIFIVLMLFVFHRLVKTRKIDSQVLAILIMGSSAVFAAFMTHSKSTPIWQSFSPLSYVQFPWRFLTLTILGLSFSVGGIVNYFSKNIIFYIGIFLIAVSMIFYFPYFEPETGKMGPITDSEKLSGVAWEMQKTAGILDYLPKTAKENPRDGKKQLAEKVSGNVEINNQIEGTNWAKFDVNVIKENSEIRINIFQFPNWKVFVDGVEVQVRIPDSEKWGRMYLDVKPGEHSVYVKFYDTTIRTISNIISLVTLILVLMFYFKYLRVNASMVK